MLSWCQLLGPHPLGHSICRMWTVTAWYSEQSHGLESEASLPIFFRLNESARFPMIWCYSSHIFLSFLRRRGVVCSWRVLCRTLGIHLNMNSRIPSLAVITNG